MEFVYAPTFMRFVILFLYHCYLVWSELEILIIDRQSRVLLKIAVTEQNQVRCLHYVFQLL